MNKYLTNTRLEKPGEGQAAGALCKSWTETVQVSSGECLKVAPVGRGCSTVCMQCLTSSLIQPDGTRTEESVGSGAGVPRSAGCFRCTDYGECTLCRVWDLIDALYCLCHPVHLTNAAGWGALCVRRGGEVSSPYSCSFQSHYRGCRYHCVLLSGRRHSCFWWALPPAMYVLMIFPLHVLRSNSWVFDWNSVSLSFILAPSTFLIFTLSSILF